jgi:hypothetical protein
MLRLFATLTIAATLSGCVGMTAGARMHALDTGNGNTLQVAQHTCKVTAALYRNNLDVPTHQQAFKVLARDLAGEAVRQWTAYCDGARPHTVSGCIVHEDLGTGDKNRGGLFCLRYEYFTLVQ